MTVVADTVTGAAVLQAYVEAPGDLRRRQEAIEAWMPLARKLAHRYAGRGEPIDDLLQTAMMGLIKAVDGYEPGRGVEFPAYAIPTILGELRRHFRDRAWSVRVPRRIQELSLAINKANDDLRSTLNRAPTVADVAAHLGVTEEEVIEGLDGARAYSSVSLSAPAGDEEGAPLVETLGVEEQAYELVDFRLALRSAWPVLDDRERRIIELRFVHEQTQSQIAEDIGVSQMHVSRLLTRALAKLRAHMEAA